jgi:hypothetical protein
MTDESVAPPPARPPWWKRGGLILMLLLLPAAIALLVMSSRPLERSALSLAYPYQLDPEEGFILDQALRLRVGESIYRSIHEPPYVVGNYPPVYPAVYALATVVAGPRLETGRFLVFLSTLGIAMVLLLGLLRETDRLVAAMLAVGLFATTWPLNNWIAFARVDLPAIALGMAGFLVLTRRDIGRVAGIAGCLLLAAAFLTKQTQVVVPAAILVALLWRRRWRDAGLFAAAMAVLAGGGFLLLVLLTRGEAFRHLILYNINEMVPGQVAIWIRHLLFFGTAQFVALGIAVAGLGVLEAIDIRARREPDPDEARGLFVPATFAFAALSALTIPSIGKAGAAANYLLEFHAAAALLAGLVVARLADRLDGYAPARALTWGVGILFVALMSAHAWITSGKPFDPPPSMMVRDQIAFVDVELMDREGEILAQEPVFAIRNGSRAWYQPFIMSQLAREGKWDPAPFVDDLRAARFAVLVLNGNPEDERNLPAGFTAEMLDAIREAYEVERLVRGYVLMVPKGTARPGGGGGLMVNPVHHNESGLPEERGARQVVRML